MKRYLPAAVRIIVALASFACVIPLEPLVIRQFGMRAEAKSVIVGLLAAALLFAFVQLIKAFIGLRVLSGTASPAIGMFHQEGLFKGSRVIWRERVPERIRAAVHYGMWGTIVVLFSYRFAVVGTFDDWTQSVLFTQYFRYSKSVAMDTLAPPPIARLALVTDDNNTERYLRDVAVIAHHLNEVGAKVVIAQQPLSGLASHLRTMSERMHRRSAASGSTLASERDVIDSLGRVIMLYSPQENIPYQLHEKDSTIIVNSNQREEFEHLTGMSAAYSPMVAWVPVWSSPVGRHRYTEIDVALEAVKRYRGWPDSLKPIKKDGAVILGDLRIPVQPNGRAFADRQLYQGQWLPIIAHHGYVASAYDSLSSDSLRYWTDVIGFQWATVKSPMGQLHRDLKEFRQFFEGKIVVVNWYNLSDRFGEYPFGAIDLTNVIGSVVTGRFYERMPLLWWTVLILSVALVAVAVITTRATVSFWLSFLWSAMVSAFGIWVFFAYHRMFEFLYIDVAILLSFLIFTLVKMSRAQDR